MERLSSSETNVNSRRNKDPIGQFFFFFLKWRITFVLFGQPLANSKIYLEKLRRRIHFSRDIEK